MNLNHRQFPAVSGTALAALPGLLPARLGAQADYGPRMLEVKTLFAEREVRSLNEPFVGITTHHH